MGNHQVQVEDRLIVFMRKAASGLAEISSTGTIRFANETALAWIHPAFSSFHIRSNNLFDLVAASDAGFAEQMRNFAMTVTDDAEHSFSGLVTFPSGHDVPACLISLDKLGDDSLVAHLDLHAAKTNGDPALRQALLEKAVLHGKFEIASNILHDIGNAVVGISSYLTRIKRSLELDNPENLLNLAEFFEQQREGMTGVLGEAKADAVVKLINSIAQTQKNNQHDIEKSVSEQQHIISHIQEILNIQRQYVHSAGPSEKRPTHLSSIINDCMSMLYASLTKRGIVITQDIPDELPVIKGDRTKLMQVVLNILKNSIEAIDIYAPDKTITLTADAANDILNLYIRDTGKGFDEETGKKIFTRGFTTKSTGTGLGLDHCRTILENHHGSIHIASEGPGKGALTTMTFSILE